MRALLLFFILFIVFGCQTKSNSDNNAKYNFKKLSNNKEVSKYRFKKDSTYYFKPNPNRGFNFGYYVYLPKDLDTINVNTIIVESTNTGSNDTINHHKREAYKAASKFSLGYFIAKRLKVPLMVPVIPRPYKNWQLYTHALDSDTFNQKDSEFERLDLQLLAMFDDAKMQLKHKGIKTETKFIMVGFSASGTFANRFSILHPNKLKAVCAGGVNSVLTIPKNRINNDTLNFPIGTNNIKENTANGFNKEEFKKLPQFLFMGANDKNDAAKFKDAYNDNERELIYKY